MSLIAVFVASLLGSLHCAAMCGGLVCYYSAGASGAKSSHGAYHLGRAIAYSTLGAIAGTVGQSLNLLGENAGYRGLAALVSISALLIWTMFDWRKLSTGGAAQPGKLQQKLGALISSFGQSWTERAFLIGLLTGIFPCGWLYGFVLTAASTGSALKGALLMFVFFLGTVPWLLGVAGFSAILQKKLGTQAPRLTLACLVFAALFSLLTQLNPTASTNSHEHHCHE